MELILKYFPDLTEEQKKQFAALYDLYTDWNSKINVISRKDIENLYEHHVLHSLGIDAPCRFTENHPQEHLPQTAECFSQWTNLPERRRIGERGDAFQKQNHHVEFERIL